MSATLSTTRQNVRYKLGDTTPSNFAISSMTLDRIIVDVVMEWSSRVGRGVNWSAGGATLTVGSLADYTIGGGSTQYARVLVARISETGVTLERVSFDEINAAREGLIATTSRADPTRFALWETATQAATFRIDTVPSHARTIDFLFSQMQSRSFDSSASFGFSDLGLVGIENEAAARAAEQMSDDERARIKLNPQAIASWHATGARLMLEERERQDRLARAGYGVGAILGR